MRIPNVWPLIFQQKIDRQFSFIFIHINTQKKKKFSSNYISFMYSPTATTITSYPHRKKSSCFSWRTNQTKLDNVHNMQIFYCINWKFMKIFDQPIMEFARKFFFFFFLLEIISLLLRFKGFPVCTVFISQCLTYFCLLDSLCIVVLLILWGRLGNIHWLLFN